MKYVTLLSVCVLLSCTFENRNLQKNLSIDSDIYNRVTKNDGLDSASPDIAQISDIHHLSPTLYNPNSDYFRRFSYNSEGRTVQFTTEILAALKTDLENRGVKTLLLSGDLSSLGNIETHRNLADILHNFEKSEISVFVTPGNHDINNPNANKFTQEGIIKGETISPKEFEEIYINFGFNEAIIKDDKSLSYLAVLNENYLLLALDTASYEENIKSGKSESRGVIRESEYQFIESSLKIAKEMGREVIVMTHHNFLEHYEVDFDLSNFTINDSGRALNQLIEGGVKLSLSGHIHKNDIKEYTLNSNKFYGIANTSISLYPHSYRLISSSENSLKIFTTELDSELIQEPFSDSLDKYLNRTYLEIREDLKKENSIKDSEEMARYFYLVNLYAQLGMETNIPEKILNSKGLKLWHNSESFLKTFALNLPIDSYPDDRNFLLTY